MKVNFTGGFSGHSYDQEQYFGGNKEGFPMEVTTARHGRGKSTAKATGGERASKARVSKAEVEMAGVKAARARAVEKTAVAERGKRSTTTPFVKALVKAGIASPRAMQSRV